MPDLLVCVERRATALWRAGHARVYCQLQCGGCQKVAPPTGVLLALLFRFQESAEFQFGISLRTRRDYIKQIKRIERDFGDFPIKALDDPRAVDIFLKWRDQLAQTSLRQADYAYGTLARIFSWAVKRRLIKTNPCAEGGKLYHGTRVDKIWDDEQVARFLRTAPPLSTAGDAARNQHRTAARRPATPAVERLRWQCDQGAPKEDWHVCSDPGCRRTEGCTRHGTKAKPDHAYQ
jgi:hypothetical protein